ncbi:hypothetical protein QFZ58_002245 [Streptomyces sp. B1I3]|nr:hypothetical protein [Streptomyces sp. B1I3]
MATTPTSCLSKPMRGGHVPGDDLSGDGVVPRPALADVVEQGRYQEEVGAADATGEGGGPDGRLDEVAVDGPGVDGVVLRAAVDPLPVGQQAGDDALRLEGLPDADGGLSRTEQGDEFLAGLRGPRHGQRLGRGPEVTYEVPGERQSGLGRRRGGPQGQDGILLRARGAREHDFALGLDDALGERGALRGGFGPPAEQRPQPGPHGAGAQDAVDLAPGDVGGVGDGPGGFVHLAQQGVGVEEAECPGDLFLFLQGEAVGGPAGGEVEGVADVQEGAARFGEAFARGVGDPGRGDGAQGGGVPEAAPGLLEVGLQQELELTHALGPFTAERVERGKAFGGLVAPVGEDRGAYSRDQTEVSGDGPRVEETEVDLEVLPRGRPCLAGGAYGVVEGQAEVPHRVPDPVGECRDGCGVGTAVVQEHEVEVAARGEFAAPVPADGGQGRAADARRLGGCGEQGAQPVVGEPGQGGTARRPWLRLLLEEAQPGRRVAAGSRVL